MKPRKSFGHKEKPPSHSGGRRTHFGDQARRQNPGGAVWLYGLHAVRAALKNPARRIHRLVLTPEVARSWRDGRSDGPEPQILSRVDIDHLLPRGAVHQGVALQVEPLEEPGLEDSCLPGKEKGNIVIILDQVTDPQNVGAILRSAAAFGATAVIVTDRHAPEATGALAKAAAGALELVPLVRVVNLARTMEKLGDWGYWRLGLDGGADQTLATAAPGQGHIALALGAEGAGLRRLTRENCDLLVRLPIAPAMESLNVSNAAACALYELARTRG